MRMNYADIVLQLLVLLPISFVSAAAVSYFVPRAGATDVGDTHLASDPGHAQPLSDKDQLIERIVQSQWEKHRRWALVYKGRRNELQRARKAKLTFISLGAVAQVAATQVPTKYKATTALFGGLFVAAGGYIKTNYVTNDAVKEMVSSFYISQALKSEVNKFRAKAGAYQGHAENALQNFRDRCNALSRAGKDKRFHITQKDLKPVPKKMGNKYEYFENRLDPVINHFYLKKGRRLAKRGEVCSRLEDCLLLAGTLTGLGATQTFPGKLQSVMEGLTGWAGAFTTVSAAFANHHAKMKFEEIAEEYFDTADRLLEVKDNWPITVNKASDPGWDEEVMKCEALILSTVEDFAKKRSGNKELEFFKPKQSTVEKYAQKVWNPNVVCGNDESGSYPASERAKWLVENNSVTMAEAQKQIMEEFPDNF